MTLYHIAQQLLLLDHDQWKKTLNEDFGSNIRANILCDFLSSNFFKKEIKLSRTPQTLFLKLEAKQLTQVPHQNPLPLGYEKILHFFVLFSISSSWKWQSEGHHLITNVL